MQLSNKFYTGWLVHAGLFLCAAVISGSSSYVFGLFVVPVAEDLDLSRANINNGFIALLLGAALFSPVAGRLLDRFSARMVMLSGGIAYAGGMAALTLTDSSLLILLIILVPIAYGFSACGTLGVNTVIVRWFKRRRGRALGVMAVATSAGGFFLVPFTATMIEDFGWRTALLINASIALTAIVLMTLLIVRNFPRGTEPGYNEEFNIAEDDGTGNSEEKEKEKEEQLWTYGELIRNRNFWFLTLAIGLMLGSDQAMVTAQVPHFLDMGIDMQAAAFIAASMTVSAICGKLLIGYLADKVDLRYLFYGVALAHVALQLVYVAQPGYWTLFIFATLFGIAIGGVFPLWSTMLAWIFGTRNYGTVMGLMTIATKLLAIVGVRGIGEVYDVTGSYVPGFIAFMVAMLVSALLAAMMRPAKPVVGGKPALTH